jgi:hypothetical protein
MIEGVALYYKDEKVRKLIDKKLHEMSVISANLGIDSTQKENKEANKKIGRLESEINNLSPNFLRSLD